MRLLKLLILPVFAFSFDVEFNKKFYHELPHDMLTTNISISIDDDSEQKVSKRLEVFNQKIKNFNKVEKKLGSFNIRPKYRHAKNTPKIIGYTGVLRYTINSYKAEPMDEFISNIVSLKENRDTNVSVSNLSWTVTEDTYNVALDLLRLQSIQWAQNYVKNLSKDVHAKCEIEDISINQSSYFRGYNRSYAYQNDAKVANVVAVPEANQEKISIDVRYKVECK